MPEARKNFYGSAWLSTGILEVVLFVDDLVMLAEAEKAPQNNLQGLNFEVNAERVEQVNEMKYLGTMISRDGSMDSEVE